MHTWHAWYEPVYVHVYMHTHGVHAQARRGDKTCLMDRMHVYNIILSLDVYYSIQMQVLYWMYVCWLYCWVLTCLVLWTSLWNCLRASQTPSTIQPQSDLDETCISCPTVLRALATLCMFPLIVCSGKKHCMRNTEKGRHYADHIEALILVHVHVYTCIWLYISTLYVHMYVNITWDLNSNTNHVYDI